MSLLTPRRGGQRSTIRERATRARTIGPTEVPSLRIAIVVGLLVGLLPAIALLVLSARSAAPQMTEEPTSIAAVRTVLPTPTRQPTPRATPTPWPPDLWIRMVILPTPNIGSDQVDVEIPVDAAVLPDSSTAAPAGASQTLTSQTSTPEPDVVSPAEIASIEATAQIAIAAEAAQVTPVSTAASSNGLGAAVPSSVRRWESLILAATNRYKVDPNLVAAVMMTESGGHENDLSGKGAVGLMQVVGGPYDPAQNILLGTAILASNLRRYGGRADLALAGYNAGNGAVAKYGGIPPYRETRDYVFRVILRYELYTSG